MLRGIGADVKDGITKKTTILIIGHILEDRRPPEQGKKYMEAKKNNIPIMTEDEFDSFLFNLTGKNIS